MISYSFLTDTGDRPVNEDSIGHCLDSSVGLFIVADGLGGHGAGDIASDYVVKNYLMQYSEEFCGSPERYFSSVFTDIQSGLLELQKKLGKDMKSTAASVILSDRKLSICHIGDTRVYVFGRKKLLFRTLDHSVPQLLVSAGKLKEKQIRFHPDRNRLLRALGEEAATMNCDIDSLLLTPDITGVLLCSDGFWEYVDEREMLRTLRRSENAESWLSDMKAVLLKNAKKRVKDNYSAIAIRF